jgi:hypothetical protein
MSSMTIPKRINTFLIQRQERWYCDSCIQERLGLKWRQQVQLIAATLAVTNGFAREVDRCCMCEETKLVTRAQTTLRLPIRKAREFREPAPNEARRVRQ